MSHVCGEGGEPTGILTCPGNPQAFSYDTPDAELDCGVPDYDSLGMIVCRVIGIEIGHPPAV
jgi:hypothetical protein